MQKYLYIHYTSLIFWISQSQAICHAIHVCAKSSAARHLSPRAPSMFHECDFKDRSDYNKAVVLSLLRYRRKQKWCLCFMPLLIISIMISYMQDGANSIAPPHTFCKLPEFMLRCFLKCIFVMWLTGKLLLSSSFLIHTNPTSDALTDWHRWMINCEAVLF